MARYLAARAGDGASIVTLRLATSTITKAHEWAKQESPCRDPGVRASLKGWGRRLSKPQRQAGALTVDVLAAIRITAVQPRKRGRGFETAAAGRRAGQVRSGLGGCLVRRGLRRSETASLTWGNVQRWDDGSGRITVLRSKTDTEAQGAVVGITPAAMRALDAIRPAGVYTEQKVSGCRNRRSPAGLRLPVFLTGRTSALTAGGGMAWRMAQNGAPTHEIKHHRLRLDRIHQNRYPV